MSGYVFVTQGDITRLNAHAVAYSTDQMLSLGGQLTTAFERNVPGFREGYRALREAPLAKRREAGDAYWVEATASLPRGVVVTVAAAGGKRRGERAFLATRGALLTAAENLARCGAEKPWLIALPMFLAGDGGARHDRVTVAEPQLEAAEAFVQTESDVDVVFVAYTEANYQVWLEARRRVRERSGGAAMPADPPRALVAALQRGECVLFAGSGMSTRTGLPSWQSLIERLAERLGVESEKRRDDIEYLLDLAQWYRNHRAEPSIEELVGESFTAAKSGARPTLSHYLLTSLPARYLVTTNYDDLLEVALAALRRSPERVVREADVARTGGREGCYVVKLHGCAASGGPVVLSRDDYDDFFRARPALALLLEGLLLNQSFFFVGYSLRDPDFRQVWSRIGSLLQGAKRPAFATTFDQPEGFQTSQWASKGLDLVAIEGASTADKARRLDMFLDRLGELVSRDPHLFLADDIVAPCSAEVSLLREKLLSATPQLIDACVRAASSSRSDALALVDLLRFYASHGWRGAFPGQLAGVFAALSLHQGLSQDEQRELLVAALRYSESVDAADALAARIDELRSQEHVKD